jgi:hypothetical protein
MKKILLLLIAATFLQQTNAQSFERGSLVVSANYGIDGYKINEHNVNKANNGTQDTTTGAASKNFNLGVEYGLFKWLGVGLQGKLDNYYHDDNISDAIGFEIGVLINAHIIRVNHFDLLVGVNLGFSNLTIDYPINNYQVYGSGGWSDFHITPRIYFGRFGINLNLYFPSISYPNLTTNVDTFNQYVSLSWKTASAFGATFGIQYRILN